MSSSAKRALRMLATVGESGRPMGVTEIARANGIAPGTAFRGLDALQRAHLLARHPSAPRYILGAAASALRQSVLSQFRIRDICLPYLRQLASASGETTSLHVKIGWYAVRIATVPGTAEVTSGTILGGAHILSADIAGRAILSQLCREDTLRYVSWISSNGFDIPVEIESDLAVIRARGFAQSDARNGGIAFPICKADQPFAAVVVEGPGFAHRTGKAPPAAEWLTIARAIEALVRANPSLASQPFEHLDPDRAILPS